MGIPGFNTWFKERNKDCYVPLNQIEVDHLYIDLNSVLHSALRTGERWERFHKVLHQRLNDILDKTNPRKTVMLAVDGPAPLAKLITQRERRKKVSRKGSQSAISSTAITPGTHFMADVTLSLAFWVHTKLGQHRFSHLQFELSDATVQGEGEVKILGRLARHWYNHGEKDTHVIVGDDADLVLMACVSWVDNLYVANCAMAGQQQGIQSDMPVFCTALLHKAWLSNMFHPSHSQMKMGNRAKLLGAKMDLMLLAVLASGNDYLPPLRGVALSSGVSGGLWPYYWKLRNQSSQGAASSICHVDEETGVPSIDLLQLASLLQACTEYHTRADSDPWDGVKATADASNYLRGCIWLLDMYINGTCPDYRYAYDGSAPSASRLIDACEQLAAEQQQPHLKHAHYGPLQPERLQPLLPFASAMALLPASGRALMPAAARHLIGTSSPLLSDMFAECDVCTALSERLREATQENLKSKNRAEAVAGRLKAATKANDQAEIASLDSALSRADQEYNAAKSKLNAVIQDRQHHLRDMHPYEPFPIERLVRAASTVDIDEFDESELPLASFSSPVVVARAQGRASNAPPSPFPHGFSRPIPKAVWRILETRPATTAHTSQPSSSTSSPQGLSTLSAGVAGGRRGLGLRNERAQLQPDELWVPGLLKRRYLAAPPGFAAKQQQQQQQQQPQGSSNWRRPASPALQQGSRKRFAPVALPAAAGVGSASVKASSRPGMGAGKGSHATPPAEDGGVSSSGLHASSQGVAATEPAPLSHTASASHPMSGGGGTLGRGGRGFGYHGGGRGRRSQGQAVPEARGVEDSRSGRGRGASRRGRAMEQGAGGGQQERQAYVPPAAAAAAPPPMPSATLLSAATAGVRPPFSVGTGHVRGSNYQSVGYGMQPPRPPMLPPHPMALHPPPSPSLPHAQRFPGSSHHLRWP